MSMERLFGGTANEAQMQSLHSDCKNVQKYVLKSVNVQRTGKSFLQMFAFSFLKAIIFNFVFFRHDSAEFKPA